MPQKDSLILGRDPLLDKLLGSKPRKGDLRRMQILEATIAVLGHEGLDQCSFEAVGQRAGMNKAHVNYYYRDKDELISAAIHLTIESAQDFVVSRLAKKAPRESHLECYIKAHFDWIEKFPAHRPVLSLFYYFATFEDYYKDLNTKAKVMGKERLVEALKLSYPKLPTKKISTIAENIQSLLTANLLTIATTRNSVSLLSLRKRLLSDIKNFF